MLQEINKNILIVCATAVGLLILSAFLMIWLPYLSALRLVFGTVFMLFLPGFFIMELAFPQGTSTREQQLDWVERFTMSVALSIAVVPLVVYFSNRAGIAINALNIFLEVLGLILMLFIAIVITKKRGNSRDKSGIP